MKTLQVRPRGEGGPKLAILLRTYFMDAPIYNLHNCSFKINHYKLNNSLIVMIVKSVLIIITIKTMIIMITIKNNEGKSK